MRWFSKKLKAPEGLSLLSYRTEFRLVDSKTLELLVWGRTEPAETLILKQIIRLEDLFD